jgi:hypothetical protein
MSTRLLVTAVLLAAAPAAAQGAAPDSTTTRGPASQAGDVSVSLNGGFWPVGGGVRYVVADGLSVGAALDRTVFGPADPSTRFEFQAPAEDRAFTVSASVESERGSLADWLTVGQGVALYYQRQTGDVVEGYNADFLPVLREGGRRTEGAGIALAYRGEARVFGPLRVGFSTHAVSLGVERVRGGTEERDGQIAPVEDRTRLRVGAGTSRFYLGLRL